MKFGFTAIARLVLDHVPGSSNSQHVQTDLRLELEGPLNKKMYLDKELPTVDGARSLTTAMVSGLVANIHNCHQKGWIDSAKHLRTIIAELERGFASPAAVTDNYMKPSFIDDTTISVRDGQAIQKAHDILHCVVSRKPDFKYPAEVEQRAKVAMDALCWVLNHDDNKSFNQTLNMIIADATRRGYSFELGTPEGE